MTAPTTTRRSSEVRVEESRREADQLRAELEAWVADRTRRDVHGQYRTQLAYIGGTLTSALAALREALDALDANAPRGDVYRACRALDRRLALVRRTWAYFHSKFAQRDQPRTAGVLAAADELVWSCYATAFRGATARGLVAEQPPAPLAFIDDQDTPAAVPRDEPPRDLRPDNDDEIVREHLKTLAVPVISLTFKTVSDPWWLAVLAHEVGHHLQFDLAPEGALVQGYRDTLRAAAPSDEWARWADEVFADTCSVAALGPWAGSLVEALEAGDERAMLSRRRTRYPPPLIRLALLDQIGGRLGFGPSPGWEAPTPGAAPPLDGRRDLRELAALDLAALPALAAAACTPPLPGLGSLGDLFGVDPRSFLGAVEYWRDGLTNGGRLMPDRTLQAPRQVAAGSLAAWAEVCAEPDAGRREERRGALAERLLALLPECREEGTRAAAPATVSNSERIGRALAADLLNTPLEDE